MTEPKDISNYIDAALRLSFRRIAGWQAYAAATRYGYMPNEYEYIKEGTRMFSSYTIATIPEAKATINMIIVEMGRSILSQVKGHFVYPTLPEGGQYVTIGHDVILDEPVGGSGDTGPEEVTRGSLIPQDEAGYAEIEDADEMRYRMRVLAERLRPADMATLMSYVDGEYDTLTEACGGKAAYNLFTKRMKVATRRMVMV